MITAASAMPGTTLAGPDQDLQADFERIRQRFSAPDFLANKGLGNEVSFHVFSYDPARENEVRARTSELLGAAGAGKLPCRIVHRDLWEIFLQICEDRRVLDRIPALELKRGTPAMLDQFHRTAPAEAFATALDYKGHEPGRDVLLITGVGKVYPIVRAHEVLENAQHVIEDVPVVLFYPGRYDGHQLHLFNTLADGNYYRAFNLL